MLKTIRTAKLGKIELRLVEKDNRYFGVANGPDGYRVQVEGDTADEAWQRLHDEAGKGSARYFGYDGARARFLHFFPNGFRSAGYEGDERNYKLKAKAALDTGAPVEAAAIGSGFGEIALSAFRATNMLFPVEKARIQEALRGPFADQFVRAAARFALGDGPGALAEMETALKPHNIAKWIVVTYLPFLWRPETHMFLKPEVTKDFADRVGHTYAQLYRPRLDIGVYESLLDLAARTDAEIAELKPRDRIDLQSFIYVVGDYREGRDSPKP
jgi:hypothetical protein